MIKYQEVMVKSLEKNKAVLELADGQKIQWEGAEELKVGDKLKIIISSTADIINEILRVK